MKTKRRSFAVDMTAPHLQVVIVELPNNLPTKLPLITSVEAVYMRTCQGKCCKETKGVKRYRRWYLKRNPLREKKEEVDGL